MEVAYTALLADQKQRKDWTSILWPRRWSEEQCMHCYTKKELIKEIELLRTQQFVADHPEKNNVTLQPLCSKTTDEIILKTMKLKSIPNPEAKAGRRLLALRDLLNPLNLAAMATAMLVEEGDEEQLVLDTAIKSLNQQGMDDCNQSQNSSATISYGISPFLLFNIDETALWLDHTESNDTAIIAADTKQKLKEFGLGVSIKSKGDEEDHSNGAKRRSIHLFSLTSANGQLLCVVLTIRDKNVKDLHLFQVKQINFFSICFAFHFLYISCLIVARMICS